jgi:N-acyl-D-aspartate/D-glutamate deacylase
VEDAAAIAETDHDLLREAVERGTPEFQSSVDGVGWDRIVISETSDPRWNGRDLVAIGGAMGCEPFDAMIRLLAAAPTTACIGHAMEDTDVNTILADPRVFVASDASAIDPSTAAGSLPVHPRDYGTFPRALAQARDLGLLGLEAIIAKMTSLPADRFGLRDRGRIAEGAFADLVVFNPGTIHDAATFASPHAFPAGIDAVVVGGVVAWSAGSEGIARAGRAVRSA